MTIYEFEGEKPRDLSLRPELLLLAMMLTVTLMVGALAIRDPRPLEMEPLPAALLTAGGFTA